MEINEIYKQLKYHHHLSEDDVQELAIKIWQARDKYDASKASLSTWVQKIVTNYLIDKKRKKINMPIPLSHFEYEDENGHTLSSIDEYMASDELSPIDNMIATENIEELLERIDELPLASKNILNKFLAGEYDSKKITNRTRLRRAMQALEENKQKKKYRLTNILTQEEFFVDTFDDAGQICGATRQTICNAHKENRLFFKKSWRISSF